MKTITIKKFDEMSVAKVLAALHATMGLIFGVIMFIFILIDDLGFDWPTRGLVVATGALIFLPLLYGVMGFVSGWLLTFVFNLIAPKVGGIIIEVEQSK